MPFERDEGEYAYIAQQMPKGLIPYKDVFDQKPPAIFLIYWAAFTFFGNHVFAPHLMAVISLWVSAFFIFLLGRTIDRFKTGLISALIFLILSSSMAFEASSANTELFLLGPIIISVVALVYGIKKDKLWLFGLSGVFNGIASLFKQPAILNIFFLIVTTAVYGIVQRQNIGKVVRRVTLIIIGSIVPFLISMLVFGLVGALNDYLFCTWRYNIAYSGVTSPLMALKQFSVTFPEIFLVIWPLLLVCAGTFIAGSKNRKVHFLLGWLFISALSVSTGFIFRKHYFIQLIPPIAVFTAYGLTCLLTYMKNNRPVFTLIVAVIMLSPALYNIFFNFTQSPQQLTRRYFGYMNPFVQSIKIAKYIKANTNQNDTILVVGSEPQIYFYANRKAATKYIFFYPFFLTGKKALVMQEKAIGEIRENNPKYIVSIKENFSLLILKDSSLYIMDELNKLVQQEYRPVGCVFIFPDKASEYYFDDIFNREINRFPNITNLFLDERGPNIIVFRRVKDT